jgi:hypothetical protein
MPFIPTYFEPNYMFQVFMYMLSMLNCDKLSYYVELLSYWIPPNEFYFLHIVIAKCSFT